MQQWPVHWPAFEELEQVVIGSPRLSPTKEFRCQEDVPLSG